MRIPAARDFPTGRLQLRKEHLVSELALQQASKPQPWRRRAIILVAAALLVATGFTTYVLTREPTHLESIGCFAAPDLGADTTIVSADGRDPVAICTELWRQDVVAGAAAPEPANLSACVLESGAVGVFPSSSADTCAELGLAELPADYAVEARRFAELRDAIVARLGAPATGSSRGSSKCVGEMPAREAVRRELDSHGYRDWEIEVAIVDGAGFTAERPCAEAAFDGKRRVVTLVPVWRRS
jgi:hypothetical protein